MCSMIKLIYIYIYGNKILMYILKLFIIEMGKKNEVRTVGVFYKSSR